MKSRFILFIIATLYLNLCIIPNGFSNEDESLILADSGVANYIIYYSSDEGAVVEFAARELANYLEEISGANFVLQNDTNTVLHRIIVGRNNVLALEHEAEMAFDSINDDGFRIKSIGSDIYISGVIDRGTLYGVYHLLDIYFDVRWFSPDFKVVPTENILVLSKIDDLQNPDFKHREMFNHDTDDPFYRQHNRLNGSRMHRDPVYNSYPAGINTWSKFCKAGTPELNNGGHNLYLVVPTLSYHSGGQLTMMNQGCRDEAVETFNNVIANNGTEIWYGFSQMDNGWSPDASSQTFADSHGGALSSPLVDMVIGVANKVREIYPDAKFSSSAYQWSFSPPTGLTIPDYVMIQVTPIHGNFGYAYDQPENAVIDSDIRQWNQIAENLSVWDYVANYQNYLQPLPNIYPMCENIKYFAGLEQIQGYMAQSSYNTEGAEFADLRAWVAGRLLWNANQNYKDIVYEFVDGYYGPAAFYIKQYIDALHQSLTDSESRISVKQRINSTYLNLDFIMLADQLLASADAVAGDVFAKHVHEVRLGVDMTILLLKHLYKAEAEERGISWIIDPDRRSRFSRYATEAKISSYSEGSDISSLYAAIEIDRIAPDVPGVAIGLDEKDWIDFQDLDFKICCGANLVEDSKASDHGTVKMPADGVWSTQMDLDLLPSDGEWKFYAYVRVDPKSSGTTAFNYGVSHGGGSYSVSLSTVSDGEYRVFEFPDNPWSFETGRYLWFAGSSAIENLYIDRIIAVREGAIPTRVIEKKNPIFELENNYPNPFNDVTNISYSIPENLHVNLTIYNTLGQQLLTLINKHQNAGRYQVNFDASQLSDGEYFCRLNATGEVNYVKTTKLVLIGH